MTPLTPARIEELRYRIGMRLVSNISLDDFADASDALEEFCAAAGPPITTPEMEVAQEQFFEAFPDRGSPAPPATAGSGPETALRGIVDLLANATENTAEKLSGPATAGEATPKPGPGVLDILAFNERAARAVPRETPETCEWTLDEDEGAWRTSCSNLWWLEGVATLAESRIKFCAYCGKSVRALPPSPPSDPQTSTEKTP